LPSRATVKIPAECWISDVEFVGAMVRLGYNIGVRAGPDRTEEQLAQLLESVNHVERVVTGGQPRGVVSQLRRRPEPPSSP
jgi:hypothetical protein